ncbi:MAG: RagB/SusD family nutrient uptake outer membrane protein, partial [Gemmatimonadales bacterium]|nr:RagB/SusD family nutrient uptake outer membrane protein [Gemmatimonadales bacterium]NIN50769.1 RagB/SusD family nutrient uptake outer membrane protein [Gemmatimonadales bacterium]NIP08233.1 RagB/SusD family nutrient uptake outer membrane protein [Gemmatimonadales bacterium]NIS64640.1 RagB/SusD family nutrient uptake outer membrane protein [Gemmatimonadales bacterium]
RDLYLRDIEGIDEGFGQYIRGLWQLQELPTDEAVIGWGDAGLPELVISQWGSTNQFVTAAYYRIFFQIAQANEFLRQTADERLAERGHQGIAEIPQYRAEARFLRALSYWHGLDLFGNIPLVVEVPAIGSPPPEQVTGGEVFDFIESELLDIRSELPSVGAAEYGRADQGALSMLLAKLYMNAEVYGVGDRYADALVEIQNVIGGPYSLDPDYQNMFLADN